MFRYVLSMTLFGGLIGCGGGDSTPPGGGAVAGEDEGTVCKADAADGCAAGEGEGSPNDGEGSSEGEGEGPLPSGADGEPCGGASGNECQDGLECLTCEEGNVRSVPDERSPGDTKQCEGRICTCPQWFEGTWWAEFEPRAVGYEYDFETVGGTEQQFWMDQEIPIRQEGCVITGPSSAEQVTILAKSTHTDGNVSPPPYGFYYKQASPYGEGNHWILFQGNLSADHQAIMGTCEGEFLDRPTADPDKWFNLTCNFSLTRR